MTINIEEFVNGQSFNDNVFVNLKNNALNVSTEINDLKNKNITMFTNKKNVLIELHFNFFHFITDTLGVIFKINSLDQDINFILYSPLINNDLINLSNSYIKNNIKRDTIEINRNIGLLQDWSFLLIDLQNQLNLNNIKYDILNLNTTIAHFNNIFIVQEQNSFQNYDTINILLKKLKINNKENIIKNKKIYLSRKNIYSVFSDNEKQMIKYGIVNRFFKDNKQRIDNEEKLENFLQNFCGFTILNEYSFKNGLIDQIKEINNARVIVSLTGAGSINMCFLKNNSIFVELISPILISSFNELYHLHNDILSHTINLTNKNIEHIIIPHNRNVNEVIDQIKNDKYLNSIFYQN